MKPLPETKPGDLIGFSGYDPASILVNLGTFGLPGYHISHVAIVGKDLKLYESTPYVRLKCELKQAQVYGTQIHSLEPRVADFWGKMWHYPLVRPLDMCQIATLHSYLMSEMGKGYDFIGAARSAGKIFAYLHGMWHPADDRYLFCSELCAFAHHKVDVFRTTNESKWSPNALIRAEQEQGVLGKAVRIK
jgi:hypothetical protein